VIKRGFKGLQIDILNHLVTVKITELGAVKVETVKFRFQFSSPYLSY